jgi:hypothetical protein
MGFTMAGANTRSCATASNCDPTALMIGLAGSSPNPGTDTNIQQASATYRLTELTAGSTTFTAQYRTSGGGSANFTERHMVIIPLP